MWTADGTVRRFPGRSLMASGVSGTEASEPTTRAGVGWMVNGKWIGPTWCGEYRSSSDGEMEMKSILAGEYDYVNVTLRQVAVSGNFTTIWFCAALLSVLVRCRMRVRKRRDLRPVVDAEIRLLRKEIQIGIGHRNQSK